MDLWGNAYHMIAECNHQPTADRERIISRFVYQTIITRKVTATAASAAVLLSIYATRSLGIATITARRSTQHGGRASQARGDDDPAPADTDMTRIRGQYVMDKEPPLKTEVALLRFQNPRQPYSMGRADAGEERNA